MIYRKLKRGDQVRCINNKYSNFTLNLTQNRVYTVLRAHNGFVFIENDKKLKWEYPADRFICDEIQLPARFWALEPKKQKRKP